MVIPDLLPCGYLVGDNTNITITLNGAKQSCVDSLAFDTLVPKSILHRYISLLLDHRRIILSGSSGTGKSYLARRFAEHIIIRLERCLQTLPINFVNLLRFCQICNAVGPY